MGCDLTSTSSFVEKLVDKAGVQALQPIPNLQTSHLKFDAIRKLAKTMNIDIPDYQKPKQQRMKNTAKKFAQNQHAHVVIDASQYRVKEGFLKNQDDTDACACASLCRGATGYMLLNTQEATTWLQSSNKLSQDELTLLVVGECQGGAVSQCNRISVPVYHQSGHPAVISCCMHTMGHKEMHVNSKPNVSIEVEASTVLAITTYQDEVTPEFWKKFQEAPVRSALSEITKGEKWQLPCPPWGRSWKLGQSTVAPEMANTMQFHIRIASKHVDEMLKSSGHRGIYVTPKTEQKMANAEFAVVWLDASIDKLRVLTASVDRSYGLVRVIKGKAAKSSWGIRVKQCDFDSTFALLRPNDPKPVLVQVNHLAKLSPTPTGASFDDVTKWLAKQQWTAKPIRPLGATQWLVGFTKVIDETWATWNEQLMLVNWLPTKEKKPASALVAGQVPRAVKANSQDDMEQLDPWASYFQAKGSSGMASVSRATASTAAPVARVNEGPIEERFRKQDQQIGELKETINSLTQRVDDSQSSQAKFQVAVKQEFTTMDKNFSGKVTELTKAFEESIGKAMHKQDQQLAKSFQDLKEIMMNQQARPPKKAKTETEKTDDDDDM